jgi:hypothetical protein
MAHTYVRFYQCQFTIDFQGIYVYLYSDPDSNEVFYVGKGKGNRAFAHLSDTSETDKATRIRDIRLRGHEPKIRFAMPVFDGVVQKVYEVVSWHRAAGVFLRW